MKTLTVSIRYANKAQEVIADNDLDIEATSTNTYDFEDSEDEDIEDAIRYAFSRAGILDDEYEIINNE
ncbi:hypothetical protein EZS27_032944 [termite gut metagenome]|jgi:uncharacterized protein (DUF433 family)|uniref:Uncharacterized protein n=1 Tax=termite gut metagenome TaxID=433724 RepID=A0A5J4Q8A3_9ZZZZ